MSHLRRIVSLVLVAVAATVFLGGAVGASPTVIAGSSGAGGLGMGKCCVADA